MRRLTPFALLLAAACADPQGSSPPAPAAPASLAPLVADEALPTAKRSARVPPPVAHVVISIRADGVHLDESAVWRSTPAGARWRPQAPVPARIASLPAVGATPAASLVDALTTAAKRLPAAERVAVIRADATLPYGQVAPVLSAAHGAGFEAWRVAVKGGEPGPIPLEQARRCTKATAPTPCVTSWGVITDRGLWIQNRDVSEAGCGLPLSGTWGPVDAAAPPPRGRCLLVPRKEGDLVTGVIVPHRQRHLEGPPCDRAVLSAWPEITWEEVVRAADALRKAGHTRVSLSIDLSRSGCPKPPPAASPSSGG